MNEIGALENIYIYKQIHELDTLHVSTKQYVMKIPFEPNREI